MERCGWCRGDPLMEEYHDREWGVPVHEDHEIFERMSLELFQAGLSWRTILHKRDAFRDAFFDFELDRVAAMEERDVDRLMNRSDIVRYRKKIEAVVDNARVCLLIRLQHGSLWNYIQSLEAKSLKDIQTEFKSKFSFMGPIVTESFLQSIGRAGLIHEPGCWKYR